MTRLRNRGYTRYHSSSTRLLLTRFRSLGKELVQRLAKQNKQGRRFREERERESPSSNGTLIRRWRMHANPPYSHLTLRICRQHTNQNVCRTAITLLSPACTEYETTCPPFRSFSNSPYRRATLVHEMLPCILRVFGPYMLSLFYFVPSSRSSPIIPRRIFSEQVF